jgi:hypothetical protein
MHLTFTRGPRQAAVTLEPGFEAKVYAVPENYSQDRFFVALWGAQELEPVPSCAASQIELLAHVALQAGEEGLQLHERFLLAGVSYAED